MIKFKNLPESFDLDVLRKILLEKGEIFVRDSLFSVYKFCYVPFNTLVLVRHFIHPSLDPDDFIILEGYADISDVFAILKNFKLHEND